MLRSTIFSIFPLLYYALIPALACCASVYAHPLSLSDYLQAVQQYSLQLNMAKEEVIAAQAEIGIAGLRPDPELTFSGEREHIASGQPRPLTRGLELSWEIEMAGKRRARIRSAESGLSYTLAQQQAIQQQLLLEAAHTFIQSCHDLHVLERKQHSLNAFNQIEQANAVRYQSGDIGKMEWLQSQLERDRFGAEVRLAQGQAQRSQLALVIPLGHSAPFIHELIENNRNESVLQCDFMRSLSDFSLSHINDLIKHYLPKRSDIKAAQAAVEQAQHQLHLARAERWVNPTLAIGTERTPATAAGVDFAGDEFEASARSRTLMFSLSLPLPLSRFNRGHIVQAQTGVTQAELELQQTQIQAEVEVRSAYNLYLNTLENTRHYHHHLIDDAQHVLQAMHVSYKNGAVSLLELLSAQHASDDVWLEALQAHAELAIAQVELQTSLGLPVDL